LGFEKLLFGFLVEVLSSEIAQGFLEVLDLLSLCPQLLVGHGQQVLLGAIQWSDGGWGWGTLLGKLALGLLSLLRLILKFPFGFKELLSQDSVHSILLQQFLVKLVNLALEILV
jgi:hypothetical protein